MPPTSYLFRTTEDAGRVTVRFPTGTSITEANAEAFGRDLMALAQSREPPQLTIDLGGIVMITSTALAKLLALHNHVKAAGGRLTLANPKPVIRKVLAVSRLDTVFDITSDA